MYNKAADPVAFDYQRCTFLDTTGTRARSNENIKLARATDEQGQKGFHSPEHFSYHTVGNSLLRTHLASANNVTVTEDKHIMILPTHAVYNNLPTEHWVLTTGQISRHLFFNRCQQKWFELNMDQVVEIF